MGSTADQYQDRPAGVLFCFDTSRYAAYFDISRQNTTIQGQISLFYSCCLILLYSYYHCIYWKMHVNVSTRVLTFRKFP